MDHGVETRNTSEYSSGRQAGKIGRRNSEYLPPWKFWLLSASSLLTLILLFQPWVRGSGPHGDVQSDAFGRLGGSVPGLRNVGERLTEGIVSISGLWGMLAAAAAVLTVAAACSYRLFGIGLPAVVVMGTANAVLVPATLLYLNGKVPGLREMTEFHDEFKTALGDVLTSFLAGTTSSTAAQQVGTAALTNQALICALTAVLTAVIALSTGGLVRPVTGDTGIPAESLRTDEVGHPSAGATGAPHAAEAALEQQLELVLQYARQLPDAVQYVYDDEHSVRNERLLPRSESTRRTDGSTGTVGRERPTARRRRPRPANRTPAAPQTATSGVAAAKRSAGSYGSPRSGRPVTSR